MSISSYTAILARLGRKKVEYLLIGVSGINFYADGPGSMIATQDVDILLKPVAGNMLAALKVFEAAGYRLESNGEPLVGIDGWLAERILERRAVVTAVKDDAFRVDMVTDGGGIPFQEWKKSVRVFEIEGVSVPVGDLSQLVQAKHNAGREKDKKFMALYGVQIKEMLRAAQKRKS